MHKFKIILITKRLNVNSSNTISVVMIGIQALNYPKGETAI